MTAFEVGARSETPERASFIRAQIASLLLHGLLFALKVGPASGVRAPSLPGGGVIVAVLKRSPAAPSQPDKPAEPVVEPALTASSTEAPRLKKEPEAVSRPAPPTASPGLREEGRDSQAGSTASGGESTAIPLLPPLSVAARELPRRPSLLAPVSFSYPPNTRVQNGRVRVRILLDDKGRIEEMRAVAANPQGVFEGAAIEVLRSGRFAPGFAGPIPVRSYLFMEVTFGPGPQGQQVWYAGSAFAPPAYAH